MEHDVYVYGMTVLSTIHRLKGGFPAADGYQEIVDTVSIPGGEGANCAIVLRSLGLEGIALDGCLLGEQTAAPLRSALQARGIDAERMRFLSGFEGWRDIVFCDGAHRTVFGWFVQNLFGGKRLWTEPDEEAIRGARFVALDPFFGEESVRVAELCAQHGTPYATVDCRADRPIAQRARAVVCSREFLDREYPGRDAHELIAEYRQTCDGLVVFTFGAKTVLFWPPGEATFSSLAPFPVEVVDTLGAGDTFRAGIVYGLLKEMPDAAAVRFAMACSAVVCTRFPSVHEPPTLEEVSDLLSR